MDSDYLFGIFQLFFVLLAIIKKSWKTPKRYSESINQRTDNIMAKRTKKSWKIPKG
jgi:phage-related protein